LLDSLLQENRMESVFIETLEQLDAAEFNLDVKEEINEDPIPEQSDAAECRFEMKEEPVPLAVCQVDMAEEAYRNQSADENSRQREKRGSCSDKKKNRTDGNEHNEGIQATQTELNRKIESKDIKVEDPSYQNPLVTKIFLETPKRSQV